MNPDLYIPLPTEKSGEKEKQKRKKKWTWEQTPTPKKKQIAPNTPAVITIPANEVRDPTIGSRKAVIPETKSE
jgi:hypothetical protein